MLCFRSSKRVLASTLPSLTYPSLKLRQPIFVGTGQSDQDVLAANQLELVKDACEAGATIEAHLYAGLDHSGTVMASLKHSVPFVRNLALASGHTSFAKSNAGRSTIVKPPVEAGL